MSVLRVRGPFSTRLFHLGDKDQLSGLKAFVAEHFQGTEDTRVIAGSPLFPVDLACDADVCESARHDGTIYVGDAALLAVRVDVLVFEGGGTAECSLFARIPVGVGARKRLIEAIKLELVRTGPSESSGYFVRELSAGGCDIWDDATLVSALRIPAPKSVSLKARAWAKKHKKKEYGCSVQ